MSHNPPIFYLWIYRNIRKRANGRIIISYATVMEMLKRTLRQTPKKLHYPILKDLEKYGLLKKIDKHRVEVIGGNADLSLNQYNCPV